MYISADSSPIIMSRQVEEAGFEMLGYGSRSYSSFCHCRTMMELHVLA